MALALLKWKNTTEKSTVFEINVGTNEWFQIALGKKRVSRNGFQYIDEILFQTPIKKLLTQNPFNPRTDVEIDNQKVPDGTRYAQLITYRTQNKVGPSISRVIRLMPQPAILDNKLPEVPSAFTITTEQINMEHNNKPRSVSFSFSEASTSKALFWNELLQVVKVLAPQVIQGITSSDGKTSNTDQNQKMVNVVQGIIELLAKNDKVKSQKEAKKTEPKTPVMTKSIYQSGMTGNRVRSGSRYSRGQVAPIAAIIPLLGKIAPLLTKALPMLGKMSPMISKMGPMIGKMPSMIGQGMPSFDKILPAIQPMLQQAPQLLQSLIDQPQKFINLFAEIKKAQNQFNLENKKADQSHHERLLAISNLGNVYDLTPVTGAGGKAVAKSMTSSSPIKGSKIEIQKPGRINVNGKLKYAYKSESAINIPVRVLPVNNKKMIEKGIFYVKIKCLVTKKVVVEKMFKEKNIPANGIIRLSLTSEEMKSLKSDKDYLIGIGFKCLNKEGKSVLCGVDFLPVVVVEEYVFHSIGNVTGNPIVMADRSKYRDYWHKVWEGSSGDKKRWKVESNFKYYIHYNDAADANGRIETRIQNTAEEDDNERNIEGRIKSGFELSPDGIDKMNDLFGKPRFGLYQLEAIRSDEVATAINSMASYSVKLKGKKREQGYLWVYPEVAMHELKLSKIKDVDENGAILNTELEILEIPLFTSIHVVGEKSERT